MSIKTRLNKLETGAATAESKPPLVLWPVEGKKDVYSDFSGREYSRPDFPNDRPIIRVEYDRGQHEQF